MCKAVRDQLKIWKRNRLFGIMAKAKKFKGHEYFARTLYMLCDGHSLTLSSLFMLMLLLALFVTVADSTLDW